MPILKFSRLLRRRLAAWPIAALVALAPAGGAQAHPHVFIEAAAAIVVKDQSITAVKVQWTFDELFSNTLIQDFDKNKNKQFEPDEIADLRQNAFRSLKDFGFLTWIKVDGKPIKIEPEMIVDFSAAQNKAMVVYRFTVNLKEPVHPRKTPFQVSLYDETFYIEVSLAKRNAVRVEGSACKTEVEDDVANPIFYGMVIPKRIVLACPAS
ncbi:MAG: DUF1007 family protein [Alphaproteobacteria bacterium]